MQALELTGNWETIFTGAARATLEGSILPPFLKDHERWFGADSRELIAVRLADWTELPNRACRTFLVLAEVVFGDGGTDLYFLPLGVTPAAVTAKPLVHLRGPEGQAVLHDALDVEGNCAALLEALEQGRELPTRHGTIRAVTTAALAELRGPPAQPLPASRLPGTSSNSLVRYDRRLLLKVFRRLEVGVNPDFEIGRFLTEQTTFDRIPRVGGAIEYHRPNVEPTTLAIIQAFMPSQGSGWDHALEELSAYFARVASGPATPAPDDRSLWELAGAEPPPQVRATIGPFLQEAAVLGRRTGELHRALAGATNDPAFTPESLTAADFEALAADLQNQGKLALAAVRQRLDRGQLPPDMVSAGRRFLAEGPGLLTRTAEVSAGSLKFRCHGDYHLGQVLWADHDFVLLDFEGEPTRTVAERRAKQSPLKDVAGMLRSFDYVAHFALARSADPRRQEWADFWQRWTSAAFLRAYLSLIGPPLVPPGPHPFVALLDLLMLTKVCYEVVYDLKYRPDWVRSPLHGIVSLLDRKEVHSGH